MKKRNKGFAIVLLVSAVCMLGSCVIASADTMEEILKRGELRIAVYTQGPPFSFVDKQGVRTGSSSEFCRLMAEEMGVEVKFLDFAWDALIPALLSGKADMIAADMTATLKRAMKVSFTDPFYYTATVAFMKAGNDFKSIEDCNKPEVTIAVVFGSTAEADAKRFFPNANVKAFNGGGSMLINALLAGHADIAINDESSVKGQLVDFPPNSIEFLPFALSRQPLSFAVRKEDTHLLQWVNLFFQWTREDGRYDENVNYWIKSLAWKEEH